MKESNSVFKSLLKFSVYLFAFSISLPPFFASVSLILFVILSVIQIKFRSPDIETTKFVLFLSFPFLLYLIGLLWTDFLPRGYELTLRTSPLLFIPVLIVLSKTFKAIDYSWFRNSFVLGVFSSCLLSLGNGFLKYLASFKVQHVLYYDLASTMHLHPTYFSMYILTAMVFLFGIKIRPGAKVIALLFFIIMLFLLQSKTSILILFSACGLLTIYFLRKRMVKKAALTLLPIIALITFIVFSRQSRFNELFKERTEMVIGTNLEDGTSERIWLWRTALEHMESKPLIGFGLGSKAKLFKWRVEKDILMNDYPFSTARAMKVLSNWNLHNTYLQISYEFGIIGLVLFLGSIFGVIKLSISRKQSSFLIVYGFFLIFLLIEVPLHRQMGIYYYSFVFPLLFFEKNQ